MAPCKASNGSGAARRAARVCELLVQTRARIANAAFFCTAGTRRATADDKKKLIDSVDCFIFDCDGALCAVQSPAFARAAARCRPSPLHPCVLRRCRPYPGLSHALRIPIRVQVYAMQQCSPPRESYI